MCTLVIIDKDCIDRDLNPTAMRLLIASYLLEMWRG